ncbi:MAG: CocE/NonD family hydrolase [Mesorhizobium sp.]|uniref:CocE/NonD family hydrolase n=1 Tax=Mesorhizobium sp. TaxID=1871066 RepID=UPI000FE5E737|nr:CocE/NonD family hydrolase [Mesorhizobium sp.]RWA96759.1 MAG: CocE/NonD family hydrolase [Mesorhizobium sp.]RWE17767.1 MAG: CocE/NonD family hydrolase [Mesorhizobium sp.]TJW90888.1 MAG: CocE/NonD family hydrolase [Mesorhizobium sp.]
MTNMNFRVIENEWIVLKDGTRLAARVWMPETVPGGVPAVLEFLPYRKRNGTAPRDESTYPVFAAAGIAGVRVDIRGCGESDGVIDGEYTERELADAVEVIEWIAAQDWSNGNVGMMGISWGGFNALQVAALKPPALKAVISLSSTVDRYNDDIHYKNGAHLSAQLSWAATMSAFQSRSPDPDLVGERWREMWLERLEGEPFFMEEWLSHQRRDDFWRRGSICEDFDGFSVPALVIAGWADGYRNTPLKAVSGMPELAWGLIGPWIHKYPHFASPKPRADFHAEAISWWRRWLCAEDNKAENTPRLRAYILDGPRPGRRREADPGYWVAMDKWGVRDMLTFSVDASGRLTRDNSSPAERKALLHSPQDTGTAAGEFFPVKPDSEMAGDQRVDDAGSLTFDSVVLAEECVVLGQPLVKLSLSSDTDLANIVVRLVDLHADGSATRVSYGVLNLAHRKGNAEPQPMKPGETVAVELVLDACGYRFAPGHRLRLSLSSAYWPTILPPPCDAVLVIDLSALQLQLPLLGGHRRIEVPQPPDPDPLPRYEVLTEGLSARSVERDLQQGVTHYRVHEDTGLSRHPETGLCTRDIRREVWSIAPDDPLSLAAEIHWTCAAQRTDWRTESHCTTRLSCTATEWVISERVEAVADGHKVFERERNARISRDQM